MEITAIRNPVPSLAGNTSGLFRGWGVGGWVAEEKGGKKKRWRGSKNNNNNNQKKKKREKAILYFQRGDRNPVTSTLNPNPEEEKKEKASLPEHHLCNRRFSEE